MVEKMATTTTQQPKELAREDIERIWNEGDLSFVDEHYDDEYVLHDPSLSEDIHGPEGFKSYVREFRTAFPDLEVIDYQMIAEGDTVAVRYTWRGTHEGELEGIEPTGTQVEGTGMAFVRFEDGKVREGWILDNTLGLLQQLGVVEPFGE